MQISLNVERQYYYLKGFDLSEGFFIPPWYRHLESACALFFKEYRIYSKNIFIMTKFDEHNSVLNDAISELRRVLRQEGYNPVRADDKMYVEDGDMWNNVCVYMLSCKHGIALLENYTKKEYNPNVAIEYGFMRAFNKRVLLLRDKNFPRVRLK